jgi:lipopolysaccharide export system protein LptA
MLEQPDGSMKVTGEGRPVRFRQKVEGSADWLEGHADRIEYDNRTGDVRLLGNAWFKKGGDELNSTIVTYNTVSEKYRAEGSKTGVAGSDANAGRVHLTIIPKTAPTQGPTKP